jgi:hypothetical protein
MAMAPRHSEQGETIEAQVVDDRLEVCDPHVDPYLQTVPVRQAAAARIVSNISSVASQPRQPGTPDRASQIVFDMTEPVGGADKRWPIAERGHCNACPVRSSGELNALAMLRHLLRCLVEQASLRLPWRESWVTEKHPRAAWCLDQALKCATFAQGAKDARIIASSRKAVVGRP